LTLLSFGFSAIFFDFVEGSHFSRVVEATLTSKFKEVHMQKSKTIWVVLALVATLTAGYFIGSRHSSEVTAPVVKTYSLPSNRIDEVRDSLNRLFRQQNGEALGVAQVFGNGLILVRAPEGFQGGIKRLIEQLGSEKAPQRTAVRLDSWLVVGHEDKKSNLETLPLLSTALSAIDKLDGPRKYRVLEHISANAMSGQEVSIQGAAAEIRSSTTKIDNTDELALRLEFKSKLGQIKTDTQIKPGEFLVLGQNAVSQDSRIGDEKVAGGVPTNVYYIVRAELIN
jgi:hypothetical protein